MPDYVLSCCSAVDLTAEHLAERNVRHVSYSYELGGQCYKDDMWQHQTPQSMYARMVAGEDAHTSQVTVGEFVEHFEPILQEGHDVLHVTLSSGITGTYDCACSAAELLRERYPERTVRVVDSLCASSGYGLLVDEMCDRRDQGTGLEELALWAEHARQRLNHWFFSSDLTFFVKGGRISRAAGMVGGMLRICPMMCVAPDGSLSVREKIRTKARAIERDLAIMEERAEDGLGYRGKCFISHSDCEEDARELAARIEERFTSLDGPVRVFPIGATIGCHTGPGTVALYYWGAERD